MCKCLICGHELTAVSSVEKGIGTECEAAYKKALMSAIFAEEGASLEYNWLIQLHVYRAAFLNRFSETKFRSDFRRSFYESIRNSERVSKRQLDIIIDRLNEVGVDTDALFDEIQKQKRAFLDVKEKNVKITTAAIEAARREMRKSKVAII